VSKISVIFLLLAQTVFAGEINIAVAANVSYAIDEIKAEFRKVHPDIKVVTTLGSSGKLVAQIRNGAPYGLFMSANMKYPQALYDEKIAVTRPVVYAQGALAYFSVGEQEFSKGIELLKEEKIRKIAVANPKTAPYGMAAVEAMKRAKVYDEVTSKFVYAESISQTVSYAMIAADIGIIAKSSLYSTKMRQYQEGVNWAAVDSRLYTPIEQGVVLLKGADTNTDYKVFYDFILSGKAKTIFKKYGYLFK